MQTSMLTERVAGPAIGVGIAGGVAASAAWDMPLAVTLCTAAGAGLVGLIVAFQIANGWFFGPLGRRLEAGARFVALLAFLLIVLPLFFGSGGLALEPGVANGLEVLVFLTALAAFLCGSTAALLDAAAAPADGGAGGPAPPVVTPASIAAALLTGAVVAALPALLGAGWAAAGLAGLAAGVLALLVPLQIRDGRFLPDVEGVQPLWGLTFLLIAASAFGGVGALGLDRGPQAGLALLVLTLGAAAYSAGTATEVLCRLERDDA